MTGSSAWMFADVKGEKRLQQYIDTLMLRMKVKLFYRRWRRTKRVFLSGWMSRG